jgi:hypothetical protein
VTATSNDRDSPGNSRWLARGLLVLGGLGLLIGQSGGYAIWAAAWFIAGGAVATFTPSTYGAFFVGNDLSRLLNRVGGIGFIVLGIGLLVAAAT